MKRRLIPLCIFSVLAAVIAHAVFAGVDPQPFRSETNRLNAVINGLTSLEWRLTDVLKPPPDDGKPPPDDSIIGKLGAMSNKLQALDGRTSGAVSGLPLGGSIPQQTRDALQGVSDGASSIVSKVVGYKPPPDDQIVGALRDVQTNAQSIVDTVRPYLSLPPEPPLPPEP